MTQTTFSHQKANSPEARYTDGGLRSFFVYRDTGVTAATNGQVRLQLVRAANRSSEAKGGSGFHFHTADVHVVKWSAAGPSSTMTGSIPWSRPATASTSVLGIVHSLYDWSDDMELMEIIMPWISPPPR